MADDRPPGDEWTAVSGEWEIWSGPADERVTRAAADIEANTARVTTTMICTACKGRAQKALAREFATSVGRVWRVYDRKDFVTDELDHPGAPIVCPVHGATSVGASARAW